TGSAAATSPATGAASTPVATPTAVKPQAAATATGTRDPSDTILAELAEGHTAVVLFSGSSASDDRAVRAAVRRVDRRGGKVDVHVVPIARVGDYEAITRGVTVLQAPTTLVIGRRKTAEKVVGFTTTAELDQLVADTRRAR
ncbi:MAG: hypothetical protein JWM31_589, partial [Solirubrobacterales bacterium]|nr:hypothetical protein [Solirubrobacterales bacterium]